MLTKLGMPGIHEVKSGGDGEPVAFDPASRGTLTYDWNPENVETEGTAVTSVIDGQGNQNAQQASAVSRPQAGYMINDAPALYYNGTDSYIEVPALPDKCDIWMLTQADETADDQLSFGGDANSFFGIFQDATFENTEIWRGPAVNVWTKNGLEFSGTTRKDAYDFIVNNHEPLVVNITVATGGENIRQIGWWSTDWAWKGLIGRILVYTGNLTTADKNYIGTGLAAEAGLTYQTSSNV